MTTDEAFEIIVDTARKASSEHWRFAEELDVSEPVVEHLLAKPELLDEEQRWFLVRAVWGIADSEGDERLVSACELMLDAAYADLLADLEDELPELPPPPEYRTLQALRSTPMDEWVTRLMSTFRLDVNPRVLKAARRRARQTGRDLTDVKRDALEIGLRLALAQTTEPWVPRRDSRRTPVIPAAEFDHDQLRAWVDREARKAAACELREIEYPQPGEEEGKDYELLATEDVELADANRRERHNNDAREPVRHDAIVRDLLAAAQGSDSRVLETWLTTKNPTYEGVAALLGKSPESVKQAIYRIRKLARQRGAGG